MDTELEAFKEINLSEYAAAEGYELDRKASSRNSAVMRRGEGDKIIVARGEDGHWIYCAVHDARDPGGSIIDFVMHRERCSLGRARQILRSWTGGTRHSVRPHPDLFARTLEPVTRDRSRVVFALARMKPLAFHRYLETERRIPRALLQDPRFAGTIRIDARSNVVFPHADRDGPCGYEMRNAGFRGFSPGGTKGLWFSAARKGDTVLVIAESGIDALSYAALHPESAARYASTGGAMNPGQPALIRAAVAKMAEGARIIAATDNDQAGRDLAEEIEAAAREAGRSDLAFIRDLPPGEGQDWNDVLRAQVPSPSPAP
jgi:hypothetical protein